MKDLKLEDYSIIKEYLDLANYEGYNSNFVTMMMWNHEYHIQYEIHEHFMVMLHNFKGTRFWAMPFTSPEYYQEAIDYMIEYSYENSFDFCIDCAIEDFVDRIKPLYNDVLLFERTSYNDDYIYDRQMLQTLSGKKMQKRRNHYNSFINEHPDYVYRDLDITNDFDTILNCLNRWEYDKDDISESMTSEVRGVMYLLSSKHLLDFEVGGIFINGQMEAFIIASLLKHSTIQIHVEKANKEIRGLYPAILKEMLEHHYPDAQYVNREEDMGLENLRRSKKLLHPVKMIKKYRIISKNIIISQASDNDYDDIKALWKQNFQDETEKSIQFYFENCYKKEHTYVLKNNNKLISVIQIVPMPTNTSPDALFILGVCTNSNFEGQGYMRMLLQYILEIYKDKPIYLQAYILEIYRKFGFNASHFHKIITINAKILNYKDYQIVHDNELLEAYYNKFTVNYDEYRLRDNKYWDLFVKRCIAFDDLIVIFKDNGYMVYHENDEEIYVSEFIYLNQAAIDVMLSYFKDSDKKLIIECDLKANIDGLSEQVITMMSNLNDKDIIDETKYINEIY